MKLRRYNYLLALGLVALCGFSGINQVIAQSVQQLDVEPVNDFIIGPGKTEIVLDPGSSVTKELRVTSRIPGSTTFSLSLEDFVGSQDPEETVKLLGSEVGPYSLRPLIELPVTEFTLEFGQQIVLPIEVRIPSDAEPGGKYGAILVSNAPSKTAEDAGATGATVVSRLGSLFLIRVSGDVFESGMLEDFSIKENKNLFFSGKPDQFEILYRNNGSVHLVPYGVIEIKNLFGSVVDQLPIDAYFALPDSLRYRVIDWESDKNLFGIYSASLELSRGYDNQVDTEKIMFAVLPWKPLAIAIVILLLLSFGIAQLSKKFELKRK